MMLLWTAWGCLSSDLRAQFTHHGINARMSLRIPEKNMNDKWHIHVGVCPGFNSAVLGFNQTIDLQKEERILEVEFGKQL